MGSHNYCMQFFAACMTFDPFGFERGKKNEIPELEDFFFFFFKVKHAEVLK